MSSEFVSFDYPNHFDTNYLKFRKIVLDAKL